MNNAVGTTSILPAPAVLGAWAWDVTDTFYEYTGATYDPLTVYTVTQTAAFQDLAGNPTVLFSFTFTTADPFPPVVTAVNVAPATYNGDTTAEFVTLTCTVDDSLTGGSPITEAEYYLGADPGDGNGIDMGAPVASGADWADYSIDIDLSLWADDTLFTVWVSGSDGQWSVDVSDTFNIDDTTPPISDYDPLSPPSGTKTANGTTETFYVDYEDFTDYSSAVYYERDFGNVSFDGPFAMTHDLWQEGSNLNDFSFTLVRNYAVVVEYYFTVEDGATPVVPFSGGIRTMEWTDEAAAEVFPLDVVGFAQWYNGTHADGYSPVNITDLTPSVVVTSYNGTAWISQPAVNTDGFGRYQVEIQPDEYIVGGLVWANFTMGTYQDSVNATVIFDGVNIMLNGTFGIPYDMFVYWVPYWDGILPAPAGNVYAPGQMFYVNVSVYDAYGNIAPGYYCYMNISTNETSLLQDLWLGGLSPTIIALDGIGGPVTDGYYNNTVQLYTAGVWAIYVNASDATGGPVTNLTWWIPGGPNGPQADPAANVTNMTHIQIAEGGFYWRPIADAWNLVSVPMNVSVALLDAGGDFWASKACEQIEAVAIWEGAAPSATQIVLAKHQLNSYNPVTYDTYEYGVGGTDFIMSIDYCYWLFVSTVDLWTDGIYIQASELERDDAKETLGNVNTITLGSSWTMLNPSASWGNSSAWANGGAVIHIDERGNTGLWSTGAGQLYDGGSWNGGVNIAWYGATGTLPQAGVYWGYGDDIGSWVDETTVTILDSGVWDPATGLWNCNNYEPLFYGITDPGWAGAANVANPLFYANGFIVWSYGGNTEYQIDYDWTNPIIDVPPY
ncbi:MAG: hypothetical protein KAS67_06990, partial [Thermoplasmata archaeon]|nr:hypothetical protein [Thermoplasmata archaeon]